MQRSPDVAGPDEAMKDGIHSAVVSAGTSSVPRNFTVNKSNDLYRTQDLRKLTEMNEARALTNEDDDNRALVMQPPPIQARVMNYHAPATTINRAIPVNTTGHVLDRHPLDKAQVYKSEGQPDQEVIEFNT